MRKNNLILLKNLHLILLFLPLCDIILKLKIYENFERLI